jgi:hypothetical protein
MRRHLNAAQVAELAELLDDAPNRVGVIDQVLQAAVEGRGMTLVLADPPTIRRAAAGCSQPTGGNLRVRRGRPRTSDPTG